jgi:succinate dehydrogenase / fumarate reductase cytochrome b subunit
MSSVERPAPKQRPVYLNLARIRLPLPGLVSILHRLSGAALFLVGIPLLLYAVQSSLASPDRFESLRALFATPVAKIVLIGLVWAYLHHFCAGLRYLLLDVHQFIELRPARQSSAVVLIASLALTALIGIRLW